MQNESYTSIFGVGLLDDLHNYFPDVLYNSQRFTSVQDLMRYIQDQTRSRFNLLDYGRRMSGYQSPAPISPAPVSTASVSTASVSPVTTIPIVSIPVHGDTGGTPDASGALLSTPIRVHARTIPHAPRVPRQPTYLYQYPTRYSAEMDGMNLMTSLLNNLIQTPDTFMNNFTDVVVYPTNQQIDAATTVETLTGTLESACPICQEDMVQGSRIRRITRCNHPFHLDCIGQWFEQSCVCPICRTDIRGG